MLRPGRPKVDNLCHVFFFLIVEIYCWWSVFVSVKHVLVGVPRLHKTGSCVLYYIMLQLRLSFHVLLVVVAVVLLVYPVAQSEYLPQVVF